MSKHACGILGEHLKMIDEPEPDCHHETPAATLYYSSDGDDYDCPRIVCDCGYTEADDFTVEWHRTDPWRGYHEVRSANGSRFVEVHDDNILSMSEDAEMLAAFDRFVRSAMDRAGIEYVR